MSKTLVVNRIAYLNTVTVGYMTINGTRIYTLEPPWMQNERFISCAPDGYYALTLGRYNKGGYDTMEFFVPGRDGMLFHRGNAVEDTRGCILVGMDLKSNAMSKAPLVLAGGTSKPAMDYLYMNCNEYDYLAIRSAMGTQWSEP